MLLDNTKNRTPLENGMACIRYTYDDMGNVVREQYLDMQGKPYLTNDRGAETQRIFDKYGNNIEESYHESGGNLYLTPSNGYAIVRKKYDDKGNNVEIAYFDAHDSLCISKDGIALITRKFDRKGDLAEVAYFDRNRHSWYVFVLHFCLLSLFCDPFCYFIIVLVYGYASI